MVIKWIRSLLSSSRKLIGTDNLGNSYYEVVKSSGKIQRTFDASIKHEDYTSGQIPHEWEAWMRGKRTQPPSQQEIDKRINYTSVVQQKARVKTQLDDENQAKALEDGLIARERTTTENPAQQAMKSPLADKQDFKEGTKSQQPHASEGTKYQPDSWAPGHQPKDGGEKYDPEQWTPGSK